MKNHTLFFQKLGKMSQNLSSAAVVIGALRVKNLRSYTTACCLSTIYFKVQQPKMINFKNLLNKNFWINFEIIKYKIDTKIAKIILIH